MTDLLPRRRGIALRVVVAMLIPISVGGLGVREGDYVMLLGKAGIDAADATSLSLLSVVVIVLTGAAVVAATSACSCSLATWRSPPRSSDSEAAQMRDWRARPLPRQSST